MKGDNITICLPVVCVHWTCNVLGVWWLNEGKGMNMLLLARSRSKWKHVWEEKKNTHSHSPYSQEMDNRATVVFQHRASTIIIIRHGKERIYGSSKASCFVWKIIIVRLISFGLFFENLLHSRVHCAVCTMYKVNGHGLKTFIIDI